MRKLKKLLCLVLTFIMLASCVSAIVFADETVTASSASTPFSDVKSDAVYYDAVKTLNAMGIINGYPDGTFMPDANVTRAEFTAMLMRTLKLGGIGSTSAAGMPFTDIDDNNSDINWAIPDINTAYAKGVINGYPEDNTFRPSANVAYEEAIKMIVCTLGYGGGVDVSVEPWYANYVSIATQLGITRVASQIGAPETPASRACIAQLLYDSLEVNLVENDERTNKTILSDYLGYKKATGVIYSNAVTSLSSADVNLRDNEISIYARDNESAVAQERTYTTTDASLKDYLGYQVEFYYTEDGSSIRTLELCVIKGKEPVVVNAKDIESGTSNSTQIKYYTDYASNTQKTLTLDKDNVVIYNGKLYGSTGANSVFDISMIPDAGEMKFIDSDNNGRYNVIEITAYEMFYVSSKSLTTYEIIDNLLYHKSGKNTLKLDVDTINNLSIVNKNGSEIGFGSISVGNVICYAESKSGNAIRKAIVLTDKITGSVSGISGDEITIAGKTYQVSKNASWITGSVASPSIQETGTFYLDINGDIIAYTKSAASVNQNYGYIVGAGKEKNSLDDVVKFRVLTSTGSTVYISTHSSTKVDGVPKSTGDAVLAAINAAADNKTGEVNQHLIKYSTRVVDGVTVFDTIYTAQGVDGGKEIVSDKLYTLSKITREREASYSGGVLVWDNGDGTTDRVNVGSAAVIIVPPDGDIDDIRTATAGAAFQATGNKVEVYDVSSTSVAKVVVLYGDDRAKEIVAETPINIITDISQATNDGNIMDKLSGHTISGNSSGSFTNWVSNKSTSSISAGLSVGDIVRAATDSDGYMLFNDESKNIIYDIDGNNSGNFGIFDYNHSKISEISDTEEYVLLVGTVYAKDDTSVAISPDSVQSADNQQLFSLSEFAGAKIFVYDTSSGKLEINEDSYESAVARLNADIAPSKVLIYMSKGDIELFCILPN